MNKILLISIRPEFSDLIFSGRKTVELRRTKPSLTAGDLVIVYTSSPSCELTGAFEVKKVDCGRPGSLWRKVRNSCGISKATYNAYFAGASTAFGIQIKKAWRLETPLKLESMRKRLSAFHPPQTYRYFARSELGILIPTLTAERLLSRSRSAGAVAKG